MYMGTIAIDARELRTSTGRYIERLVYYWQEIAHEHNYVILLKPEDMDGWQASNPRFQKVVCPHKEFTFDEQIGFKKQLDDLKPDLVHFAMVQQPVLYQGRVITTMHDLTTLRFKNPSKNPVVFKAKQEVYAWVNKRAAHKSAAIITPSQFVKDDVVKFTGVNPEKITVIYEAADPITEKPEPLASVAGKQFIMYVGRPTPHKNLERLIDAFVLLKAGHPDLYLVLAGKQDANYRRIKQKTNTRQITNIIYTDFVTDGQLRWLYEQCATYVFPSLSEGFGLPGLEAMVHGAPVVSSNTTSLPEIYGPAAHYFDPLNTQAISDAINEVLTDKNLRQTLITAGKIQAQKYSWHRMAEQTLEVYSKALQ